MKYITLPTAVGVSFLAILLAALIVGTTNAQTAPTATMPQVTPAPQVVSISEQGTVLLRGWVDSAPSAGTIRLKTWGGTWVVHTGSSTEIIPTPAVSGNLSGIAPGHFVGVAGTIAPDQPFTIQAHIVRNWTPNAISATTTPGIPNTGTTPPPSPSQNTSTTTSVTPTKLTPHGALYRGVVLTIHDFPVNKTFTMISPSGTTYRVLALPDVVLWNAVNLYTPLEHLAQGHSVRVKGVLQSDGTIIADDIWDLSL